VRKKTQPLDLRYLLHNKDYLAALATENYIQEQTFAASEVLEIAVVTLSGFESGRLREEEQDTVMRKQSLRELSCENSHFFHYFEFSIRGWECLHLMIESAHETYEPALAVPALFLDKG
jgi:hypothetical protein